MINPPATALGFEPAPWSPFRCDNRYSNRQGLSNGNCEVLVQARENEDIGRTHDGEFGMTINRLLDGDTVQAKCRRKCSQFLIVPQFARSDDPQVPVWMRRLEPRPGADEMVEAFLRMYATKRKYGALATV